MKANLSTLAFSILLGYAWIVNNTFWIYCEFFDTNRQVCPFGNWTRSTKVDETSVVKIVFGWIVVLVYFTYVVVVVVVTPQVRVTDIDAGGVAKADPELSIAETEGGWKIAQIG
jgi:hypothetical protein